MNFDADLVIRSVVSMLVITMPFDPVKVLVFNAAIADPPRGRVASATRVALYVGVILAGSALFGRPLLDILGINLDALAMASQGESSDGLIVGLVGVGVVVLSAFLSNAWLGELLGKMRQETVSVLARIGGLLLATIGAQMVLAGLKRFFS